MGERGINGEKGDKWVKGNKWEKGDKPGFGTALQGKQVTSTPQMTES